MILKGNNKKKASLTNENANWYIFKYKRHDFALDFLGNHDNDNFDVFIDESDFNFFFK